MDLEATNPSNSGRSIQFNLASSSNQNRCPTIPEEIPSGQPKPRSKSFPQIVFQPGQRDSSGSEVTLGDDNLSSYCEPFGTALPPSVLNNRVGKNRESFASSADSDMDGMLGGTGCLLHKQAGSAGPEGKKQLKGILKGGSLNKNPSSAMVRTKSYESANLFNSGSSSTTTASTSPGKNPVAPKTLPKPSKEKMDV